MKPDKPSELEMQILGVLWRGGAAPVREVLPAMPDGKERAYTTVLSAMQVMEKKGLLTRTREGLTDHWRPAVSPSRVFGPFLRNLVANVFGGQPTQVVQHLLQETDVDEADVDAIRRLLDEHQGQREASANPKAKGKRNERADRFLLDRGPGLAVAGPRCWARCGRAHWPLGRCWWRCVASPHARPGCATAWARRRWRRSCSPGLCHGRWRRASERGTAGEPGVDRPALPLARR